MSRVVVLGDSLLDRDVDGRVDRVCPDAPVPVVDADVERMRPGGAALAAALLAGHGAETVLVTALGADRAGTELRRLLEAAAVDVCDVGLHGPTPEKIRVRAAGQSLVRLDRGGGAAPVGSLSSAGLRRITGADAVLVSDYGRGLAAEGSVRRALMALPARVPLVWDPHPRGSTPIGTARLVTPNGSEAARWTPDVAGDGTAGAARRAQVLRRQWHVSGVAVTLGARGAVLAGPDGPPLAVPAPIVEGGDPCGAGDRFAGAATAALASGALLSEAVEAAVSAASAFVAAGGAAALAPPVADPQPVPRRDSAADLATRVRESGGTVVATGGCFDLLHAGHVAMLQSARSLGDCLIVCLNSDAGVRRLKGPERPLQPAADRAAVLQSLDCVDAVTVFDDDTPVQALEQLRPHVFVKGADYAVSDLPEAQALARWGGEAVVVPYLDGRSTSRLVQEVVRRVGA